MNTHHESFMITDKLAANVRTMAEPIKAAQHRIKAARPKSLAIPTGELNSE